MVGKSCHVIVHWHICLQCVEQNLSSDGCCIIYPVNTFPVNQLVIFQFKSSTVYMSSYTVNAGPGQFVAERHTAHMWIFCNATL